MDLDALKATWQTPTPHLQAPPPLRPSLVHVLIQQRSRGRLAELQRTLARLGVLSLSLSLLAFGVMWLNPFGFTHWYSFGPPLGWASALGLLGAGVLVARRRITRRTHRLPNLREALEQALALQQQSLRSLGWLSLLGQLSVFATIGAWMAEHWPQMSALEASVSVASTMFFASLTTYHFYTKQVPRIAQLQQAQQQTWLSELAELQATEA